MQLEEKERRTYEMKDDKMQKAVKKKENTNKNRSSSENKQEKR